MTEKRPEVDYPSESLREVIDKLGRVVIYEVYDESLPDRFQTLEGLEAVRLGRSRFLGVNHPTENKKVDLGAVFVYDPRVGEVEVVTLKDYEDGTEQTLDLLRRNWEYVCNITNRVVAYRKKTQHP